MAKYSDFIYGTQPYGEASRLFYSAEPVIATALSYKVVNVTWLKPQGNNGVDYVGFRVVRNQDAFPETEEDGVILYEQYAPTGFDNVSSFATRFRDGVDTPAGNAAPLTGGEFAYYRAWLLIEATGEWLKAGETVTLVPNAHDTKTNAETTETKVATDPLTGAVLFDDSNSPILIESTIKPYTLMSTHDKVLSYLPKFMVEAIGAPLGTVDDQSSEVLSNFLKGFSFTIDEFLTYIDLVFPDISGKSTSPEILRLQTFQTNFTDDPRGVTKSQKRLVRESANFYRAKGTAKALQNFVESLTGFDAEVSVSSNLMLTIQDATFYGGNSGYWVAGPGTALEVVSNQASPSLTEPKAIDGTYVAHVTVSTANSSIANGLNAPITRGVPVTAGEEYSFAYYAIFTGGSGTAALATPTISWFNKFGQMISSSTGSVSGNARNTWTEFTVAATAPDGAVYAGVGVSFNRTGNWYVDLFNFCLTTNFLLGYQEPRQVKVVLLPKKINYLLNPSFEETLSGGDNFGNWEIYPDNGGEIASLYTGSGGTLAYDGPYGAGAGFKKLQITASSTTHTDVFSTYGLGAVSAALVADIPSSTLPDGKYYTYSIYAKTTSSSPVTAHLKMVMYLSSENLLTLNLTDEDTRQVITETITLTNTWQRYSITTFVPSLNQSLIATPFSSLVFLYTAATSAVMQFDAAQLEASYRPTDYFDGSMSARGAMWDDATSPNNSKSYMYPYKDVKELRLQQSITDFLPMNTPYSVSYAVADEPFAFTGVTR